MADKPPKTPPAADPGAIASLLNSRLGGKLLATGDSLTGVSKPKPAERSEHALAGTRHLHPEGEVFVHTEHFPKGTHHGTFDLSRLEGFDSPGAWPKPRTPLSSLVFLDTETSGIGYSAFAFLVGLGRWEPGSGFTVAQFFLERGGSEAALLGAVNQALEGCTGVVTYNGACFDLPLLNRRYEAHDLEPGHAVLPHLDLLPPARARWKKKTGNAKLTTLEGRLLGYERTDDVAGAEIPRVYREYSMLGSHPDLERVLYHNALDILSLACLYTLHAEEIPAETGACAPAPRKRTMAAFKKEVAALAGAGETAGALALLRERMETDFSGDPYPFLEAAKLLEKAEGDLEGALEILERASARVWSGKDGAEIEKRSAILRKKLFL